MSPMLVLRNVIQVSVDAECNTESSHADPMKIMFLKTTEDKNVHIHECG